MGETLLIGSFWWRGYGTRRGDVVNGEEVVVVVDCLEGCLGVYSGGSEGVHERRCVDLSVCLIVEGQINLVVDPGCED